MSLTVTEASEEACSVSGSASAGNAGAPVSPASAEPCAGAVLSARVGVPDDDDCVPGWAQPARTAGVASRLSSRAVTVRGRFLTDRASQAGPPGMGTPRRHVLFLPPPANYEPPSSSGPGRRPFKAVTRVRTPLGVHRPRPTTEEEVRQGLVVKSGVHAALSRRRSRVRIPSRPQVHPGGVRSGSRTLNVAPAPGAVCTDTRPPCAATSAATIDRPSPDPPAGWEPVPPRVREGSPR